MCTKNSRLLEQRGGSPMCATRVTCCCSRMTAAHLQEAHRRRHLLVQPMLLNLMLVLLVHQHPVLLLGLVQPVLPPLVHLLVLKGQTLPWLLLLVTQLLR